MANFTTKKILWHSEFIRNTGFSQVTRNLVAHLKNDFDITVLDWDKIFTIGNPAKPQHIDGYKLLGCRQKGEHLAEVQMQKMNLDKFDCIFILNDAWHISFLLKLLKSKKYTGKVVCYFPVDGTCHDPEWYEDFDMVSMPVTYTEFAKEIVLKAAPGLSDKLRIMRHGINSGNFFRVGNKSVNELREETFKTSSLNDKFIFLNANRNQPRKRLDITMEAFSIFAKDKNDVMLYMHCGNTDASMNIAKLAERFEINDKLILTNGITHGVPDVDEKTLNLIYNICDAGLNSSMGEGWGLTGVEHASVGKPQIVPDYSATRELFKDCGLLIDCIANFTHDNIMTVGKIVSTQDMADKMEMLYSDKALYQKYSALSERKFTAPEYQWANIAEEVAVANWF